MYYVYFLKSRKDGHSVYVGYTNNLRRRLQEHNIGRGGKYTKNKGPFSLVYYEAYNSMEDAQNREQALKVHKRAYSQLKNRIKEGLKK
ncbi:GIY-YIG nuclease family protein [Patescibacteria group bacterium]|nr:GIY-YIG nuclease family protein [Patescibacteria group bacterium]MBU4162361.1 GIY-YIG nuclease family protein [Patescibacteria group bacterium]